MFSFKSKSASLKDGILGQIGEQIKAIQLGKQNAEEQGIIDFKVTSNNIHLQCLLDLLDHVMLHGLENVEHGYWPYVINLTHSSTINLISHHPQVANDLDKGRVWVFVALCDGLLESYIRLFLEEQKEVKKFYNRQSFLRDKERLLVLQTLVSGLDFVEFGLHLSQPYLGYGEVVPSIQATSPSSSQSTSPLMSSSSTLVGSDSDEIFDNQKCLGDVGNNTANVHSKKSPLSNRRKNFNGHNDNPVGNDTLLSAEMERLTIMDPRYASLDEDSTQALTNAAYSEIMNDYRLRGGSNLSIDVSVDEPLVNHSYLRTTHRKKKAKPNTLSDSPQDERQYPTLGDLQQSLDNGCREEFDESKGSAMYMSYLSDYRRSLESGSMMSAVSTDSLDQFCRDADFGSSLNLEISPQIRECINEQPTMEEVKSAKTGGENSSLDYQDAVLPNSQGMEYEGIIMGLPKRPSLDDMPGTDCDVSLDTNKLLLLSLEIYKHNEEKFHRMLRAATGHQFGQIRCAYIMITDFAVYLLRNVKFREEASFHTDFYIDFTNIKALEIGLNCQTVTIRAKKETFVISFGDEAISRSFITSLTSQMSRASPSLSLSNLVNSSALQQESFLVKWMVKNNQLNMSSSSNVSCFSLVHWCALTGRDSIIEVISYQSVMEGSLEFRSHNLLRSSRWSEGYFVLTNGTLWQYLNQSDKTARNVIDLRESRCCGCRQLHDADRKFAFEIVSSDGTGSLLVLSAKNEHEACEWIFKICQSIAESYDDETDTGCTVMKCVPSNLITTKEKLVVCLSQQNDSEFKLITSCALQNVTKVYVDNDFRNYCIIKFEFSETGGSEGSWLVSFNSEFELGKFEHTLAEAWRELFQVELQFFVLGKNETRRQARERIKTIKQQQSVYIKI